MVQSSLRGTRFPQSILAPEPGRVGRVSLRAALGLSAARQPFTGGADTAGTSAPTVNTARNALGVRDWPA